MTKKMIGLIVLGISVVTTFVVYCCVRVGAESDRRMEELNGFDFYSDDEYPDDTYLEDDDNFDLTGWEEEEDEEIE